MSEVDDIIDGDVVPWTRDDADGHDDDRSAASERDPAGTKPRRWRLDAWHAGGTVRRAVIAALLCVYPVVYMAPVLHRGGRSHLRSEGADPALLTDLDGAIRVAYVLRHMPFPWSRSSVTGVPMGESIWRWQQVSQGVQTMMLWVLAHAVAPTTAVNALVLAGWIATGAVAYALTRWLGAGELVALAAGLLCQLLPSIPTMASNYTSYVFVGVPLAVVGLATAAATQPTWPRAVALVTAVSVTLFFDPYWFFFSLFIVAVALACNVRTLVDWLKGMRRNVRVAVLATLACPLVLIGGVVALDHRAGSTSTSRPLGVASASQVEVGLRRLGDWSRSSTEGVGNVIPFLALGFATVALLRRNDRRMKTVVAICGAVVLISTRLRIDLDVVVIGSPAEYLRYAMPGVRFFQRAALIAEALMCILAVFAVRETAVAVRRHSRGVAVPVVAAAAVLVLPLSLTPRGSRHVFEPAPAYAQLRARLAGTPDAAVAALPVTKAGRYWFELSLLDVPSINALVASEPGRLLTIAASQGPGALAAYLESAGVTHLLAVSGDDRIAVDYDFDAPRFQEVQDFDVSGFEGPDANVSVYEVHASPNDEFCESCGLGSHLDLLTPSRLSGDAYGPEVSPTGDRSWWMYGERATIDPVSDQSTLHAVGDAAFDGTMSITLGSTPCGTPRTATLRRGSDERTVRIEGLASARVEFPVDSTTVRTPIEVTVDGPPCEIGTDPRTFALQVFQPHLELRGA